MSTETKTEQEGAKHTPGPWTFGTEPQPNGCPIVGTTKGLMVCMLAHSVHEPDQKETALANAKLIASAPTLAAELAETKAQRDELLAVIKEFRQKIVDYIGSSRVHDLGVIQRVNAAIARVKAGRAQA